ncbi:hypothetical protein Aperf_G00000113723 [Anoplocephala perfoliata]
MKRLIRRSLAKKIIAVIWIISATLFIPWAYYYRLSSGPDGLIICHEFWPSVTADRAFFLGVVTLLVYTAPLLFMAYCYCSIIFCIWMRVHKEQSGIGSASAEERNNKTHRTLYVDTTQAASVHDHDTASETCCCAESQRHHIDSCLMSSKLRKSEDKSRQVRLHPVGGLNRVKTMKLIKMLAIVVVSFGICWLPLFTIFNIIKFFPSYPNFSASSNATSEEIAKEDEVTQVLVLLVPFAQLLGSANSCVNPWIYCFYSKRYRRGFKRVFLCRAMKAAALRHPARLQPASVQFHRDHNLALRSVDQLTYT